MLHIYQQVERSVDIACSSYAMLSAVVGCLGLAQKKRCVHTYVRTQEQASGVAAVLTATMAFTQKGGLQ